MIKHPVRPHIWRATSSILTALVALLILSPNSVLAQNNSIGPSGLPLPRYVSLKATKAFLRAGPGDGYPIDWVYTRSRLPVLITEEYDHWRKITDSDGIEGWFHVSLLTGERTAVLINGPKRLYEKPDPTSKHVMTAEQGVVGKLKSCKTTWCALKIEGTTAWIERQYIFGAFKNETKIK